jgi:hypothetical protein
MARTPIRLVTAVVALSMGGCYLGSRAADRTLKIHQFQSTNTYIGQFEIDASQLPRDAIETRVDSGSQGTPVTSLTIDSRYAVRVLLVPAKQPRAGRPAE